MLITKRIHQVRNKILRKIFDTPVFTIPSELAYKEAVEQHTHKLPVLTPNDSQIVKTLKQEGIVITSLEELNISSTPSVLASVKKILPTLRNVLPSNKQEFALHASNAQIIEHPELFLWGLEDRLLDITENYIGLPIAYHGVYFRKDLANDVKIKSRLWHIDTEDRCVFKIIIYLHDVSAGNGPFQYISKPLTALLSNSLGYKHGYLQDKTVEPIIPQSEWISCTGAAGTVILVDTGSIFHRGKVPENSDRFALFYDYSSREPKYPYYCKSSLPQKDLLTMMPRLSTHQQKCLWKDN
ncbi:2OG-Fe(II) oxygenase [Chroococcidiopsis sp. FACHB-1243]|uniref:2OG-Fe(II) oxygenase n=1 Tax=Chroococcidiopsis sp. [FACHB-1243] TaxID=2692781 RepID=UPI001784C52E|nr:2OG-Fe(II) oxygenase [Chroococcidiopsis sp. [FACHB-1243]]MBD2309623.1 2OG-Fe(II) oxygenase [Chroococcidiopsis sp. [FACHB-1243]]